MHWSEDQRELRAAIEALGERLGEGHLERDRAGEFSHDNWKLLRESDLFRLPFEERWGGLGQSLTTTLYVLEGLGQSCRDAGLSFSATTHMVSTGVPIQRFGSPALKERFLPAVCAGEVIGAHAISEPEAGSDMLSLRTTGRVEDGHLVLNGNKAFVTNGPIADLFVVYVSTGERGSPFGITAVVVERDRPGLTVGSPMAKMGLRTSPLSELFFDDCRVPLENVIGRVGTGFVVFDHVMKWEVLCSFVVNIGEMRARLERVVDYARTREQFGKPIGSHQAVAHRIARMRVATDTARSALYEAALKVEAGEDATVEVATAKLLASEGNLASAVAAVQTFGGYGYMAEYGLEQDLRNAVAGTIYSGTTDIQYSRIATTMGL
ncbi:acyl-CoA dehydrogenase family protein [Streptomyces sp. UNOB3_S3]|uniref:acyl-CoA dehydrogenase family protein n=1 Tax=Streptomyces sp. UNOB3_S3 TaxID=2871682 RepID=UPI001E334455|nr:acyl-CoA dehydrogenase family protein [Streptomyces sp. UNOB3_S3]MCC3775381.1 acyl-CoA dehydrogenase family protein [Streptomyces sp. UNOB3_S3]